MWRPWETEQPVPQENNVLCEQNNYVLQDENLQSTSENSKTTVTTDFIGTLNKQSQRLVCDVHDYVVTNKLGKGSVTETAKIVKLSRPTARKTINKGPVTPKKCGNKEVKYSRIDNFVCDLIRREIYNYYKKGQSPTVSELLLRLQNISKFPYQESTLRGIVKSLGFRFRTLNRRRVIMESARIVSWRYRYLHRLHQLRSAGYGVVYLDETWFDTHDTVRKGWDDGTCSCALNTPVSRGKRIMVLHAGGNEGWVPNCFYLGEKHCRCESRLP